MRTRFMSAFIICSLTWILPSQAGADSTAHWPTKSWETARPEDHGMSSDFPGRLESYIADKQPKTTSMIVVRDGYIVFEKYYSGNQDTLRETWSITKSITSALIGISIQKGQIPGLDSEIVLLLKDLDKTKTNKLAQKVKIRHLLTMTSGIPKPMGYGIGIDEVQALLKSSLQVEPGQTFDYNEINPNLLSMILTDGTGLLMVDYAKQYLFEPIGIAFYKWAPVMGYTLGGYGLMMSSRDLAKLGYLVLHDGNWESQQIIPSEWIKESTRKQAMPGQIYDGKPKEYGFLWWLLYFGTHRAYVAYGYDSQIICVVPDLSIVAVATGDREKSGDRLDIIKDIIVPAIVADK
jgi:CubicO group peptidase (beta-lactamase class C family)